MKDTMTICMSCAEDCRAAGYTLMKISQDKKITCGICGEDRYGAAYCVTKGEKKKGGKR